MQASAGEADAAAGARTLPAGKLAAYAGRLRADRLDRLCRAVGDHGVRESFDLSYDSLPELVRRLFGLPGLHPGHDQLLSECLAIGRELGVAASPT